MKSTPWSLGALVLLSFTICPLQLTAQDAVAQDSYREPVSHSSVISGGPLMLLAGWFNAEYETKLSESLTVGAAGGWLSRDDTDYTGINAILRYYHQGAALTGFYIGGRGGVYNVGRDKVEQGDDSETALGFGVDIGYGWLLGPGRAFYVGLGIGATALIGLDLDGADSIIPAIRLLDVGVAF